MSIPQYDLKEIGEAEAKIVLPGQGRSVITGRSSYTFKVTGEDTYGKFGLFEARMQPGYGIKPHTHRQLLEMFFVVEGQMTFLVGEHQQVLEKGAIATIPRNEKHAFANSSDTGSIMHIMFCPAAKREHYFEALAEMTKQAAALDPEALRRFWEANDQFPVEDNNWPY